MALVIGDGDGGNLGVLLHGGPRTADGDGFVEDGRHVVIQVQHLGAHTLDEQRRLKAEPVQNQPGLVADMPQPGGHVLPLPQGVLQSRVGHGGDHRIGVGVPVSGHINLLHDILSLFITSELKGRK